MSESEKNDEKRFDSLYAPVNPSKWQTRLSVIDRFQHDGGTKEDEYYFFHKYRSLVIAIGRKKELSNDDIKELVSSVFSAVFAEFAKISSGEKPEIKLGLQDNGHFYHFKSWLTRIIKNKIYDIYRAYDRTGKNIDESADADAEADQQAAEPDNEVDALWQKFLLREALQELRENIGATQFRVFYQVKMKGKKGPQVAAAFRLSSNNVNQICSRGCKELREIVDALITEHPAEKYSEEELCKFIDAADKEFRELDSEFYPET